MSWYHETRIERMKQRRIEQKQEEQKLIEKYGNKKISAAKLIKYTKHFADDNSYIDPKRLLRMIENGELD